MATVLRLKRRSDVSPLEALMVASKKRKTEDSDAEASASSLETKVISPLTTIANFAGTIDSQESDNVKHLIKSFTKDKLKSSFKSHEVDALSKRRDKMKQDSSESRYKVISCLRALDSQNLKDPDENLTVIDIEAVQETEDSQGELNYVYDLYYTSEDFDVENISVNPWNETLVFEELKEDQEVADDYSDDSNSESNWRNDYPDSEKSGNSGDEGEEEEGVYYDCSYAEDNWTNHRSSKHKNSDNEDDDCYSLDDYSESMGDYPNSGNSGGSENSEDEENIKQAAVDLNALTVNNR